MSCIRFNTPEQREQLRMPVPLTSEQAASQHPVPVVTESKLRRLRVLAQNPDPKIRESVASSRAAPTDILAALAADADHGVRGCVARNETAAASVLRSLAADPSEVVRGWLAVNAAVPSDAFEVLERDVSEMVRGLVAWKRSHGTTQYL